MPLTDLVITEDDVAGRARLPRSGWLTMGPRVQAFEQRVRRVRGRRSTPVAVSSGTAALHLAMIAAGIGPGDEVIVPDLDVRRRCGAAVRYCGAMPVLCDVAARATSTSIPTTSRARITPRTRAVIAVHFIGYPADVEELRALCDEHGLG